jgi:hypothetical protein
MILIKKNHLSYKHNCAELYFEILNMVNTNDEEKFGINIHIKWAGVLSGGARVHSFALQYVLQKQYMDRIYHYC